MRLRQLAKLEHIKIEQELDERRKEQKGLEKILRTASALEDLVISEIEADVKTFGDKRRTRHRGSGEGRRRDRRSIDEPVTVIFSRNGWVRARQGQGVDPTTLSFKEGDSLGALVPVPDRRSGRVPRLQGARVHGRGLAAAAGARRRRAGIVAGRRAGRRARSCTASPASRRRSVLVASIGRLRLRRAGSRDMLSNRRAGREFMSVRETDVPVAPFVFEMAKGNLAVAVSSGGKMLAFDLDEVGYLAKGRGVVLMGLDKSETLVGVAVTAEKRVEVSGTGRGGKDNVVEIKGAELRSLRRPSARCKGRVLPEKVKKPSGVGVPAEARAMSAAGVAAPHVLGCHQWFDAVSVSGRRRQRQRRASPHCSVVNLVRSGRKQPQPLTASAGGQARHLPASPPPGSGGGRRLGATGPTARIPACPIRSSPASGGRASFDDAGRAGARRPGADARARAAAAASRLPLHRHARRRQDHARAHPREVAELRDRHHAQPCGMCSRVHRDRRRPLRRPDRGRRGHQHQGGRDARSCSRTRVYAPTRGRFKVYVIDEVHMLSNSAFNAMLKTLEEPPEHIKFILATTDPQKIPVTVLSRCLQFNLKQMPPASIVGAPRRASWARRASPPKPRRCACSRRRRAGSMRDALSLLDQAIAYAAGTVSEAAVRGMLGTVDQTYLFRVLEAIAAARRAGRDRGRGRTRDAQRCPSTARSQELATLLHRIALAQAVAGGARRTISRARAHRRAGRRDRSGERAALLPDRDPGAAGPAACAGRVRGIQHGADAHAGVRARVVGCCAASGCGRAAPARPLRPRPPPTGLQRCAAQPRLRRPRRAAAAHGTGRGRRPDGGTFDGDWPALIRRLPLAGLAKQLGERCELASHTANRFDLVAAGGAQAARGSHADKLKATLAQYLGPPIALNVSIGDVNGATSVSAIAEGERRARQAEAARGHRRRSLRAGAGVRLRRPDRIRQTRHLEGTRSDDERSACRPDEAGAADAGKHAQDAGAACDGRGRRPVGRRAREGRHDLQARREARDHRSVAPRRRQGHARGPRRRRRERRRAARRGDRAGEDGGLHRRAWVCRRG